jgi:hypothetical protein
MAPAQFPELRDQAMQGALTDSSNLEALALWPYAHCLGYNQPATPPVSLKQRHRIFGAR